jgi:hypothetical protein
MTAEMVEPAEYVETEAHQRISPAVADVTAAVGWLSKVSMDHNSTTIEEAAGLLAGVRAARKALGQIENDLEVWLGVATKDQQLKSPFQVEHVGSVTVRKTAKKTEWDTDKLLVQVMHAFAAADPDGQLPDVFQYRDLLAATASIGYWRVGELTKLGIDVSEYRTVTPGRWTVDIQGGEKP